MAKQEYIKLRTFIVQWVNHPKYGNRSQYVAEDLLFEDITTDLRSFAVADDLPRKGSMIHFADKSNMCIITRDVDIKIPIGGF